MGTGGESSCTIAHLLFVISLDNLSRFPVIAQKSQLGKAAEEKAPRVGRADKGRLIQWHCARLVLGPNDGGRWFSLGPALGLIRQWRLARRTEERGWGRGRGGGNATTINDPVTRNQQVIPLSLLSLLPISLSFLRVLYRCYIRYVCWDVSLVPYSNCCINYSHGSVFSLVIMCLPWNRWVTF